VALMEGPGEKRERRGGAPGDRFDDDVLARDLRNVLLDHLPVVLRGGDVDVLEGYDATDALDRLVDDGLATHEGLHLLGQALPAERPQPGSGAAGNHDGIAM